MIDLAFENIDNACPFNLTHHPALALPCGMIEGCPIGLMLVAKPFAEATRRMLQLMRSSNRLIGAGPKWHDISGRWIDGNDRDSKTSSNADFAFMPIGDSR